MDREDGRPVAPGTSVGLGRVVDNRGGLGQDTPDTAEGPLVEEASEDSFPASDPPTFMSHKATPDDREATDPGARDLPGTELPDRADPA